MTQTKTNQNQANGDSAGAAANAVWNALEGIITVFGSVFLGVAKGCIYGIPALPVKRPQFWLWCLAIFPMSWSIGYNVVPRHYAFVEPLWGANSTAFLAVLLMLLIFALHRFRTIGRYQRKLDTLSIKNGVGDQPKVVSISHANQYQTCLTLKSKSVGLDKYKAKKNDLAAAFGEIIEDISTGKDPSFIRIKLTKKLIPKKCLYSDLEQYVRKPYSIVIGESLRGIESTQITSLPHMLIAGTTGGGKSVFFKQALLSLLKTSRHIQMYLLDLKGGVEMQPFQELPNVSVVKCEEDAVSTLQAIQAEMERRLAYLEQNKRTSVNPDADNLDLILVGVDEASVLYGKRSGRGNSNDLINQARDITDDLTKRGRAASIHVVLATQKVTKETIDTKVQENVGGRMCFRMNTLQNSNNVIGNKLAYELPDIKGRGIWATGNEFIQVQAPYLDQEELVEELIEIKSEFENQKRKINQKMISIKDYTSEEAQNVGDSD